MRLRWAWTQRTTTLRCDKAIHQHAEAVCLPCSWILKYTLHLLHSLVPAEDPVVMCYWDN